MNELFMRWLEENTREYRADDDSEMKINTAETYGSLRLIKFVDGTSLAVEVKK